MKSIWRKYNGALIPNTPPHIDIDVTGIEEKIKEENITTQAKAGKFFKADW